VWGGVVGFGVGVGCGEESEVWILHGCLLGGEGAGDEEGCSEEASLDGD
jgi:hypothetical protein